MNLQHGSTMIEIDASVQDFETSAVYCPCKSAINNTYRFRPQEPPFSFCAVLLAVQEALCSVIAISILPTARIVIRA